MMNTDKIIIKIGSSLLTGAGNQLNLEMIEKIAAEVSELKRAGKQAVIVSSGAVASGRTAPALQGNFPVAVDKQSPAAVLREQILAAVGQPTLMRAYQRVFQNYGIVCAQILVTRADFADRDRYLSLRTVVANLLQLDIVPIVNENDVLSTEELDFSDNDQLGCMMAAMLGAERLLILTNVPGVMDRSPGDQAAQIVPEVKEINAAKGLAHDSDKDRLGKGGMLSKLEAADLITSLGIPMYIASGYEPRIITRLVLAGERLGTYFPAVGKKLSSRKAWISAAAASKGKITVSTYLADLLRQRYVASILLRGVEEVAETETFKKGDIVSLCDIDGTVLGRGETRYDAEQLREQLRQRASQSQERSAGGEKIVIHYDYFIFV